MKIANKISLSFFATALLLTVVMGLIFHQEAKDNLKKAIFSHLETIVKSRKNHIETFLELKKEAIKQLSKSIVFEQLLLADKEGEDYNKRLSEAERRLKSTSAVFEDIYGLFILDKNGIVLLSSDEEVLIGGDKSADPYFLDAKARVSINAHMSTHREGPSIIFSAPITDSRTAQFLGVVAASSNLSSLTKVTTDQTGMMNTGEVYLIDENGYMITPSRFIKDAFPKQKVDTENIRKAFTDVKQFGEKEHQHTPLLYPDYQGALVLGSRAHIDPLQLVLVAEIDEAEVLAPLWKIKYLLISIIVVTPILAWLIGILVGGIISRPIQLLHKGSEIVGSGQLDYKVATDAKDEIGQLSRAFDKMTENLKHLIEREKQLASKATTAEIERERAKELEKAYTELQEAQEMLIQAEKLNAVGQLASGVAHEVRNPLGIMLQGIDYLERQLSAKLKKRKDVNETFFIVKDSVKRANKIVNTLLDFSRATKLNLRPEDLSSIIEDSLSLTQNRSKLRNIEIIREIKQDIPKVLVDRNRIEQVFINIFLNAIQAMPENGRITIRAHDLQLGALKNGIGRRKDDYFRVGERVLVVEVTDTGKGISPENLTRVFDPFFSTKGPSEGAGLGLSVSRNIINMHKGIIDIESQKGRGTKVIIYLKIAS